MATKKQAQATARKLRRQYPDMTVNVKEIAKDVWGVRFSKKGERDRFDWRKEAAGEYPHGSYAEWAAKHPTR